ncbi:MAG: pyridoxal phosphate-dependent aminotransferase family protein [Desulfovibrionales bacterium]|nr:pyridoxal phosphate-dependent aminotransferase family protein [Desulfovibrionales bacterium]
MPDRHHILDRLKAVLQTHYAAGLGRALLPIDSREGQNVRMLGEECLDFSSNDFLGLAQDRQAARELAKLSQTSGCGSGSSRSVTGTRRSTLDAENALAAYFGYESCLILGSGFLANLTLISTLFGDNDTLILDKRAHTSTVAGVLHCRARFHTFQHNSLDHLEKVLHAHPAEAVLTESLFSMDADSPDFFCMEKLKQKFNFLCIVDEAHALGVLGEGGRGLAHNVADMTVGTLGKAFGLFGAFLLIPEIVREYLINFGQGFIYTTALPPWHGDMVLAMLQRISQADDRRDHLRRLASTARTLLRDAGLAVRGQAHILAIEVGDAARCQLLAQALRRCGILVFAARYPTVPLGRAMLRICLTSRHTENDIRSLRDALINVQDAMRP